MENCIYKIFLTQELVESESNINILDLLILQNDAFYISREIGDAQAEGRFIAEIDILRSEILRRMAAPEK